MLIDGFNNKKNLLQIICSQWIKLWWRWYFKPLRISQRNAQSNKYHFSMIRLAKIKTLVNIYQGLGKQIFSKTANRILSGTISFAVYLSEIKVYTPIDPVIHCYKLSYRHSHTITEYLLQHCSSSKKNPEIYPSVY